MVDLEKNILEVLAKLITCLKSIKQKMDSTVADLGKVQEKVDLAIASINSTQDVMKNLKKRVRSREDRFPKTLFVLSQCKINCKRKPQTYKALGQILVDYSCTHCAPVPIASPRDAQPGLAQQGEVS
jgi:hypothetical protein